MIFLHANFTQVDMCSQMQNVMFVVVVLLFCVTFLDGVLFYIAWLSWSAGRPPHVIDPLWRPNYSTPAGSRVNPPSFFALVDEFPGCVLIVVARGLGGLMPPVSSPMAGVGSTLGLLPAEGHPRGWL